MAAAVAVAALLSFSGESQAVLISCPASFTTDGTAKVTDGSGNFTAADDCQYIDPPDNSNTATLANVNAAGFFGFSDWMDNGQTQVGGGNGQNGTWIISNVDFAMYDYMIVYKDGNGTNLIAFSFNEMFSSGDWITPFVDPPFEIKGSKDVSHYSIFKRLGDRPPPPDVPEPGTLGLLGLGLLGLGLLTRRRRARIRVD